MGPQLSEIMRVRIGKKVVSRVLAQVYKYTEEIMRMLKLALVPTDAVVAVRGTRFLLASEQIVPMQLCLSSFFRLYFYDEKCIAFF